MALLMYLNKERFRPENPLIFDTHLNDDVFMSFVDLIPAVIKRKLSIIYFNHCIQFYYRTPILLSVYK